MEMMQLDIFGNAKIIRKKNEKSKIEKNYDKIINKLIEQLKNYIKEGVLIRSDDLYNISLDYPYKIEKTWGDEYGLYFVPDSDTVKIYQHLVERNGTLKELLSLDLAQGALNNIRQFIIDNPNATIEEFIKRFRINEPIKRYFRYAETKDKELLEKVALTIIEFKKMRSFIDTSHKKFNPLKNRRGRNEGKPGCFDGLCIEKNIEKIFPFAREYS
ncbi:hypothetical protein [Nitrosophilus labii]|uniref:hypothetical protein n=1 Tax=Nitrosophilus labii TaxID=2706014 RepID=UPI0016573734|nr:hypothetical protein [Nitrosophilus labii]